MNRRLGNTMKVFFIVMVLAQCAFSYEDISSRALIALPKDSGDVFLGWRLLNEDSSTTGFYIYRSTVSGSYGAPLNDGSPLMDATNYIDTTTTVGETYYYIVKPVDGGVIGNSTNEAQVTTSMTGNNMFNFTWDAIDYESPWFFMGDLNGDGFLDILARYNSASRRGVTTDDTLTASVYIDAYLFDPTTTHWTPIWTYFAGTSPYRRETKYAVPVLVWDYTNDGKDEVVLVRSDGDWWPYGEPHYDTHGGLIMVLDSIQCTMVMLDGMTGSVIRTRPVPKHPDLRYILGPAYLTPDMQPSILLQQGAYASVGGVRLVAYDAIFDLLWGLGCGEIGDNHASHYLVTGDVDGDLIDEILVGDNLVKQNGDSAWVVWSLGRDHMDQNIICDVDPDSNNGLEILFSYEAPWGDEVNSPACLVKAIDGSYIWDYPNRYIDAKMAWVANVTNDFPNCECYAACEYEGRADLFTASGDCIFTADTCTRRYGYAALGPYISGPWPWRYRYVDWNRYAKPIRWTGGDIKQFVRIYDADGVLRIFNWDYGQSGENDYSLTQAGLPTEGFGWSPSDFFGDYREDIVITYLHGLQIITNTDAINHREPTYLGDRKYRQAQNSAPLYKGYYPMPGPPGNGRISGFVFDTLGTGISDIKIESSDGKYCFSDDSGYYSINYLPAGTYTITPVDVRYGFTPSEKIITLATDDTDTTGQNFVGRYTALYENDFNTCVLPIDWDPLTPSRWSVGDDCGSCVYYINTTDYTFTSGGGLGEYSLIDGLNTEDFSFYLKARSREDLSSNGYADYAVVFAYQDTNNYYFVMFNSAENATSVNKVVDGTRIVIDTYHNPTVSSYTFSNIIVSRTGSNIIVVFNSDTIFDVSDATFGAGQIGVGSLNDAASFDDIIITGYGSYNRPPTVDAGDNQFIEFPTNWVNLTGIANDDGMPVPPGSLICYWTVISGPDDVSFGDSTELYTTATFDSFGTYVLRLSAFDGEWTNYDDMTVVYTDTGAGEETLTVVLNSNIIDNALEVNTSWSGSMDGNNGNLDHLSFGTEDEGTYYRRFRTVLAFDLSGSGISPFDEIIDAKLKLYVYENDNDGSLRTINLHKILVNWDELTSCWNRNLSGGSLWDGCSPNDTWAVSAPISTIYKSTEYNCWFEWTGSGIKNLVQDWIANPSQNYGILIKLLSDDESANHKFRFYSSEYSSSVYHPTLEISYSRSLKINETGKITAPYILNRNYPNPFNNTTSISYYLPNDGYITLEIYDYLGKKIFTLADGNFGAGKHTEYWNGTDNNGIAVPSGIYFIKLKSEQTTITGKMLLLK